MTFGGGITTANGSPFASGSGWKAPCSSQACCQRASVPTGSYVLASSGTEARHCFVHARKALFAQVNGTTFRRGRDGAELLIPNQNFFTQEAESHTAEETSRRDVVAVGAAYHHEPKQVIAILEEVARQHEKVLQYPPPAAFTVDFADSSINYKLLFWVRNPLEAFGVGSDLRQAIWNAFDENGIGIPFPQRQLYPMEWPPAKEQSLRLGHASRQLQSETENTDSINSINKDI